MSLHLGDHPAVIVHGGVDMEDCDATYATLRDAARAAWERLTVDGAARAAVDALAVLEADPAFNAGFGSVLTRDGNVETDGAVADGEGRFAAIGAAPGLRNPAAVALGLLDEPETAILSGDGAVVFARGLGFDVEDLVTDEQLTALGALANGHHCSRFTGRRTPTETVGCIVVDAAGAVCAAASTGGLQGKRHGRIGDAAMLGAGIWADRRFGVLCSGAGESAIRTSLASRVAADGAAGPLDDAVAGWVETIAQVPDTIIAVLAVDATRSEVSAAHNGASFPVIARTAAGTFVVPAGRLPAGAIL